MARRDGKSFRSALLGHLVQVSYFVVLHAVGHMFRNLASYPSVRLLGSDFNLLAHGPRGTEAKHPLCVFRFHPADGSLVLLNIMGDAKQVINPAFSRYHPRLNVVYTCTEDICNNGKVIAYTVGFNGELAQLGEPVDAGGTSTCYLTIDHAGKNLLCVNYWDSTLASIPLDVETGVMLGPVSHIYDPKHGQKVIAEGRIHGGVNHSCNDGKFRGAAKSYGRDRWISLTFKNFLITRQKTQFEVARQIPIHTLWCLILLLAALLLCQIWARM